jgi:hypothetical protein
MINASFSKYNRYACQYFYLNTKSEATRMYCFMSLGFILHLLPLPATSKSRSFYLETMHTRHFRCVSMASPFCFFAYSSSLSLSLSHVLVRRRTNHIIWALNENNYIRLAVNSVMTLGSQA